MTGFVDNAPGQVYDKIRETITAGTFEEKSARQQISLLVKGRQPDHRTKMLTAIIQLASNDRVEADKGKRQNESDAYNVVNQICVDLQNQTEA